MIDSTDLKAHRAAVSILTGRTARGPLDGRQVAELETAHGSRWAGTATDILPGVGPDEGRDRRACADGRSASCHGATG